MDGKRRTQGDGTWTSLGGAQWKYQISLGKNPDGSRNRPAHVGTRKECQAWAADLRAKHHLGLPTVSSAELLSTYLPRWLNLRRPFVKPRTLSAYEMHIKHQIIPHIGQLPLDGIRRSHVEAMMVKATEAGASHTTANHARTVLGTALKDAMRDGLLVQNPVPLSRPLPNPRTPVEPFTEAETRVLLSHLQGSRLYGPVLLAARLGMRQGEVLGLAFKDVSGEVLTISRTLRASSGGTYLLETTKSGKTRALPLPPDVIQAIQSEADRQAFERKKGGWQKEWDAWGLVFRTEQGRPLDARRLLDQFHEALEAAGLPRKRFHDLRHGTATHMLNAGVDIRVIQQVLGHSTIAVTADTYAHPSLDAMREAIR